MKKIEAENLNVMARSFCSKKNEMSGLVCTESDDVLLSEQQKFHEFHMKFFESQQHLKIRIGFALTERCREMRQRIEATEVCKLFECHAIHFQLEEIMT